MLSKNITRLPYIYSVAISIAVLVGSCCTIKTIKPVKINDDTNLLPPEPSYLGVKSCISNTDFLLAIKSNIENPIVKDDKPFKAVAEILATEDITFESLVEVLISPYKPGYWQNVAVKTYQTVREAYGCWLKPWKWGSCWKDVLKEVWVTTQIWIEPQLAIYQWQTVAVTKIIDKVFSPEVTIHYPTYLDDIKISFSGNKFTIIGYTTTITKIDVESKLLPLTPEIKLKSILGLDIKCEITIEGDINITNEKKVVVSLNVPKFNVITPLDKLPKIAGKDFYQYLIADIGLAKITEKGLESLSKKSLEKSIDKLLEKNDEKLDFKGKINYVAQAMSGPKELSKDIWLNLNPIELSSSQLNGSGNNLCINVGLKFEPSVSYIPKAPSTDPNEVPFKVQDIQPPVTNINLKLSGSLDKLASLISENVNKELESNGNTILKKLYVKNVDMYRTEGNKIVIALDVYSKAKLFKCKVFSAYLIGNLLYEDNIKQFSLKDVNFDINTRSAILNSIYKEFIDEKIENTIESNAVFNVESNFRKANELLTKLSYNSDYGSLTGSAELVKLSGPFISNTSVDVIAHLKGDFAFNIIFKKPESFSSAYLPGTTYENLELRNKTINSKNLYDRTDPLFAPEIGKLLDDSAYDNVKRFLILNKKLQQDFSKYNRIDFVNPPKKEDDENKFIYIIDSKGNKVKKRKSFGDDILPGEEFIFIDKNGEIKKSIYK